MLIKGGRVINPSTNLDEIKDVLIIDGIIKRLMMKYWMKQII